MDLQMPVMDGHEATVTLRADARFQHLPIIAMTAHAMVEERERCLREGMQDHISKPIEPAALYNCVRRWLGKDMAGAGDHPQPLQVDELPEIAGLDREAGLRRLGGNRQLYRKLLDQFVERFAESPARISEQLSIDPRAAEREAHALRGVAANLGVLQVQSLAGEVEQALHVGEPLPMIEAGLKQLAQAMQDFCKALQALPQPPTTEAVTAPAAELLPRLHRLLQDNDGAAMGLIEQHGPGLRKQLGHSFAAVEQAINQYDYDAALALLGVLAQRSGISLAAGSPLGSSV